MSFTTTYRQADQASNASGSTETSGMERQSAAMMQRMLTNERQYHEQSVALLREATEQKTEEMERLAAMSESVAARLQTGLRGMMAGTVSLMAESLGRLAVEGTMNLRQFSANLLTLLGRTMVSTGAAILALNIALSSIGSAAGLGAAVALIGAGGLLLGLASALKGAGARSTAGSGASSRSASSAQPVQSAGTNNRRESDKKEESRTVVYHFHGPILGDEGSARTIIETLNRSRGTQGRLATSLVGG